MTMSPLQESLVFMAVGMGLVFTTLVVVGLSIKAMTAIAERMAPPALEPTPAPPAAIPMPEEIRSEVLAIIAAAVCATYGPRQRIVAVRRDSSSGTWSTSSRSILHRSHNLPHKGSGPQQPK